MGEVQYQYLEACSENTLALGLGLKPQVHHLGDLMHDASALCASVFHWAHADRIIRTHPARLEGEYVLQYLLVDGTWYRAGAIVAIMEKLFFPGWSMAMGGRRGHAQLAL